MRRALLLLLLAAQAAHADDTKSPWAVGVTAEQKATAKQHLEEGNAAFVEHKYAEALARYQEAIAAWKHPAIRFNVVRCLIQLGRNVEAADELEQALAYGADPFEDAVYTDAIAYQKLLAQQVGQVVVACKQADVALTLDGQPLPKCPATTTRKVAPGQHQLVATKQGFITRTLDLTVFGGKRETADVELQPLAAAARIEHRYAVWKPWVVFASGFAIAGIGGLVELQAANNMDAFDRTVRTDCATTSCQLDAVDNPARERAKLDNAIAISVMTVGAATIVTGAVLLYINRARTVYPESREKITPTLAPATGGATAGISLRF